jgi:type IV pilus assembly protein PilB
MAQQQTPKAKANVPNPLIIDLFSLEGRLDKDQIDSVLSIQRKLKITIEEALVASKLINDQEIAERYSEHFRMPMMPTGLPTIEDKEMLSELIPEKFAREHRVAALKRGDESALVAFVDPSSLAIQNQLRILTGLSIEPTVGALAKVNKALDTLYGVRDEVKEVTEELIVVEQEEDAQENIENLLDLDAEVEGGVETHIVRLVNRIIKGAISDRASDIHLEPHPDELKVRLRIDGALADYTPVPKTSAIPLVSRIKILCKMDIAEKRVPQDGAMQVNFKGKQIDLRVSTVPTIWGEKVVMRVLNKDAVSLELSSLGFTEKQQEYFRVAAASSHGLIFVTGPTGSGKSTTLYATLTLLKSPTKNLLTVEDPVEYKLPGINQTQVKASVGLDFSRVLRAFLRQDPDVIMVGEVRDAETAQICLKAALTGHLVLSTLHTNDALSTVSRLVDLGLEPFMLAASVRLIEAQRLVRRLCAVCKDPMVPTQEIHETYNIPMGLTIFRPKGCDQCRNTGYKGRIGIFEVVPIVPVLANMIQERASLQALKTEGKKQGIMFLKDHGIERAKQGISSLEEVNRVTLVEE